MSDTNILLPILALFTLCAIVVFALISKKRTDARKHDPSDPGSSISRDTPDPAFVPDEGETHKDIHPDKNSPKGPDRKI